jgi:hypothetical protein
VRDSKDPFGPVLAITADERSAFTAGRKASEFDGAWRWAFLVMRDKNTSLAASRLVSPCATRSTTPCPDLVRLAQPCCALGGAVLALADARRAQGGADSHGVAVRAAWR